MRKNIICCIIYLVVIFPLFCENKFPWIQEFEKELFNYKNSNTYRLEKYNYNINQNALDITIRKFEQADDPQKWRENYNNAEIYVLNLRNDFKLDEETFFLYTIIEKSKYYYIPGQKQSILFPANSLSSLNLSQGRIIDDKSSFVFWIKNFSASSVLTEKTKSGIVKYDPDKLEHFPLAEYEFNGSFESFISRPWVEGSDGNGIGESIEFDISNSSLFILNGFVDLRRPYLYKQNNRIKECILYITTDNGLKEQNIYFDDYIYFKYIELPKTKNTKHVKLVITDIYKGTKYNDLAITSIYTGGTGIDN